MVAVVQELQCASSPTTMVSLQVMLHDLMNPTSIVFCAFFCNQEGLMRTPRCS